MVSIDRHSNGLEAQSAGVGSRIDLGAARARNAVADPGWKRVRDGLTRQREEEVRHTLIVFADDVDIRGDRDAELHEQFVAGRDTFARAQPLFARASNSIKRRGNLVGRFGGGRR
jgi:hypothetical protein